MGSKSKICDHCGHKYTGEYLTVGKFQCTVCKKWKDREDFNKRTNGTRGIISMCKICSRIRAHHYNAKTAAAKLEAKKLMEENPTTD